MIRKFKINIINKIKKYPILFYFITSSIINATLLRIFTVKNYFDVKPLLMDIGIIILLSAISFLVKEKQRKKYFLIITILLSAVCIVNSMYYTYYKSFASFSMLATSVFVVDVGDAVVENVIQIKDIVFIWQIIGLLYIFREEKKKNIKDYSLSKKIKIKQMLLLSGFCCAVVLILSTPSDYARLGKEWNKKGVVINFGIYLYQINDLFQSLKPQLNNILGHDKAMKETREYYEKNEYENKEKNEYTGIFEGKNLIVIHAESLQTLAINLEINGKEVTPNLNKLVSEGIFFSNFYSQVGVGTSSDAEFTFSTSLLPSSNGTVFVNYYDRKFVTIQKLLREKGYYVASMHANVGSFWNRATMHENMGYNIFYDKSYYNIDDTIGLGLSDKSFFHQSVDKIEKIKNENSLFYINLITLTNHTPFSDLDKMEEFDTSMYVEIDNQTVKREYINNTVLGNYFKSVHYADSAIGDFLEELDEKELLDNTVVVIYGDHDARIDEEYYNLYYNYDGVEDRILTENDYGYTKFNEYTYELNRKVPFIIWTKDMKFEQVVSTAMGMIDAMPTLGNMFGFYNKYQLGTDIFSVDDNTVVFVDGSYVSNKVYYNNPKEESYSIENNAISEENIRTSCQKADKIIEISNNIIEYDLIRELEEE